MANHPLVTLRELSPSLSKSTDPAISERALHASLQTGDEEWTAWLLGALHKKFPGSNRVARLGALVKESTGNFSDALNAYKDILLNSGPEDIWVRKRMGMLLKKLDEKSSCNFLEKQTEIFSVDSELHQEQAIAAVKSIDIKKAIFHFEEILLCQPNSVYNLLTYGELQAAIGENVAARKLFAHALRHKPTDLRALWLLHAMIDSKQTQRQSSGGKSKNEKNESQGILKDLETETKKKLLNIYSQNNAAIKVKNAVLSLLDFRV